MNISNWVYLENSERLINLNGFREIYFIHGSLLRLVGWDSSITDIEDAIDIQNFKKNVLHL